MRILITNNTLAERAGSELFVRDLALALMRRGHWPVAYSSHLGEVAEELRRASVPVIDDLGALSEAPDLIHAQHHLDAMAAMLRFPGVPVVYVCHSWLLWEELPIAFPTIRRHVAVDDLCRERLITTPGIDPARVEVIYNFADLARFRPRGPLRERPRRALVFSNGAHDDASLAAIRAACAGHGIAVDVAGASSGQAVAEPEALLPAYDLVFAKARAAIEAMAVGTAVIVADQAGLAGLVTRDNVEALRRLNFGMRTMQAGEVTEEAVGAAIAAYDAEDAAAVSAFIRSHAGMEQAVDRWLALYAAVLAEPTPPPAEGEIAKAASHYLQTLAPWLKQLHREAVASGAERQRAAAALAAGEADRDVALAERDTLVAAQDAALAARSAVVAEQATVLAERDAALAERDSVLAAHEAVVSERDAALARWQAIRNSRTWRLMRPLHAVVGWLRGER
jgi:hypothetical protein